MTLKILPVSTRQNVGVDWHKGKAFAKAVKELTDENKLVVRGEQARRNCVDIINKFVATVPKGDKESARKALCAKAGIVLRTFERWTAEVNQRTEIGNEIYQAATDADYEITPLSIRNLADAKRLNPGKTPAEIVRKAMNDGARTKAIAPKTPLDTRESLVQALNEHLETTQGDIESVLKVLRNSPIPREQLCKMCKELADGK